MSCKLVSTDTLKLTSADTGRFRPGEIVVAFDATYGPVSAMFVKLTEAVAVVGSPIYPVVASFTVAGAFLCSDDENGVGVVGQELCLGACLSSAATTAACYGFVQLSGLNLVALTTDGAVAAGGVLIPTATDGTWGNAAATQAVNEAGSATYTVYNDCGYGMGKALAADSSTTSAAGSVWLCSPFMGLPTN